MKQVSEKDVKSSLNQFHSRIRAVVSRAFEEWSGVQKYRAENHLSTLRYPRTIANYVFDAIVREAISEFGNDPEVHIVHKAQTVLFCFGSTVIGRFKKANKAKMGQNIPTQAFLSFVDPQQSLPGFPPEATKVEFTWCANKTGTEIEKVMVIARNIGQVLWWYELENTVETITSIPDFTPKQSKTESQLVLPKQNKRKKSTKGTK